MDYVTYEESGILTGGFCQDLHVDHASAHIEVDADVRRDWVLYVANEARDGVELAPPVVADPDVVKAAQWEAIKVERDRRLLMGGYPVGGHWYHSDLISRSQHLSNARKADLVLAVAGDMEAQFMVGAYPMYVKSMDNGLMPVTGVIAHAIMASAEMQELTTYGAALTHKAAMEAAEDPANYNFSGGWPAIYGDA